AGVAPRPCARHRAKNPPPVPSRPKPSSTPPLPSPAPAPAAGPLAAVPDPASPAIAPDPDGPLPNPTPLPPDSLLPSPWPPPPARTPTRVASLPSNSPLAAPFLLSGDIISVSLLGCRTLSHPRPDFFAAFAPFAANENGLILCFVVARAHSKLAQFSP